MTLNSYSRYNKDIAHTKYFIKHTADVLNFIIVILTALLAKYWPLNNSSIIEVYTYNKISVFKISHKEKRPGCPFLI